MAFLKILLNTIGLLNDQYASYISSSCNGFSQIKKKQVSQRQLLFLFASPAVTFFKVDGWKVLSNQMSDFMCFALQKRWLLYIRRGEFVALYGGQLRS